MAKKVITLVAPGGGKVNVTDAVSISSLVYGSGYKVEGYKTPEAAIAALDTAQTPMGADEVKAREQAAAKKQS